MARKKSKKNVSFITALVVFLIFLSKIYLDPTTELPNNEISSTPPPATCTIPEDKEGLLKIHYIDVGQADSILLTLNDESMLIDAGNNADGNLVVDYIKAQGITDLDYVVGTHPHEDHIGGLDDVIDSYNIEAVLMPKVQNNTKTFEDVLDSIAAKNLKVTSPKVGDIYDFSTAKFTILSCKNEKSDELNTVSIVIRLEFGDQSYIFCADAEKENEYAMMDSGLTLKSNVIKIGHHGSTTSSLEKFLLAVDPEIAVISVGEGNDYNHPHEKIVNRLNRLGIKTYRTDLNGTIVITSDGKENWVTVEKGE